VNRLRHQYKVILFFFIFLVSCSSYREIRVERKFPDQNPEKNNPYYVVIHTGGSGIPASEKFHYYHIIKYMAVKSHDRNLSKILKQSSEEFSMGNHYSAAILLKDASEIWDNGAAENNLAVIYELTGEKDLAFNMYTRALLREPENRIFRHNFLSFINRKDPAQ